MPNTMKAKKVAARRDVLMRGLSHLSFVWATYPVPENTLLGLDISGWPFGADNSCKGMDWSLAERSKEACSELAG